MSHNTARRLRQPMTEPLEARLVLAATVVSALPDLFVQPGAAQQTIALVNHLDDPLTTGKFVHVETTQGDIHIQLYDQAAPLTVANFLSYADADLYNGTFFHRAVTGFVLQGGGFRFNGGNTEHIPTFPPVVNEFSPTRSNVRGTVAMAKVGGDPNSATSEFFFNVANNGEPPPNGLDYQNGGFTVFGNVLFGNMSLVDGIMNLPRVGNVPVADAGAGVTSSNVVRINSVEAEQGTDVTYAATSSNPGAVGVAVVNGQLQLTYGSSPGVSTVTVSATDAFGNTVTDTFTVGVGATEVVVGNGGARQLQFADSDGTFNTISVTGGTATVTLVGTDLVTTPGGTTTTVTGTIPGIAGVTFTSSTAATRLRITSAGGNGAVNLTNLTAGDLGQIDARGTVLTGAGQLGSADRVRLAGITGGELEITGTAVAPQLRIGSLSDAEVSSSAAISRFDANTVFGDSEITAPGVGRLTVVDRMEGELNLTDGAAGLAQARVGTLAADWNVAGPVGKVTVNADQTADSIVSVSNAVAGWTVRGAMRGGLFAQNLLSAKLGTMEAAEIDIAGGAIGADVVKFSAGSMTDSEVRADRNILSARVAGAMTRSFLFAGVRDDVAAPFATGDFDNPASVIANVRVGSFADSGVAAPTITKGQLGSTTDTPGTSDLFGVTADTIGSLRFVLDATPVTLTAADDQGDVDATFATVGVAPANFDVTVV